MTVAGVAGDKAAKCSRDVVIVPDKSLQDVAKAFEIFHLILNNRNK